MLDKDNKLTLLLRDFHAHNVSLDKQGNPVSAHGEEHHTMVRVKPSGKLDTLFHTYNLEEFFGGNCTYTPQGEILFGLSHYIWRIDKAGKKHKASEHYFEWNQAIYADEDGNIYGPDIGVGNGVLVKITPGGKAEIIARDLISKLDRPRDKHNDVLLGMTKGCDGLMYICELAGRRVIQIAEDGKLNNFYVAKEGWYPTAIDFFSGDAYIMEYKDGPTGMEGPRITLVKENGSTEVLFKYNPYKQTDRSSIEPPTSSWSFYYWALPLLLAGLAGIIFLRRKE